VRNGIGLGVHALPLGLLPGVLLRVSPPRRGSFKCFLGLLELCSEADRKLLPLGPILRSRGPLTGGGREIGSQGLGIGRIGLPLGHGCRNLGGNFHSWDNPVAALRVPHVALPWCRGGEGSGGLGRGQ